MKKSTFTAGIIIVLIIGFFLGIHIGMSIRIQLKNKITAACIDQGKRIEIICVVEDIPGGTVLTESNIGKTTVLKSSFSLHDRCIPPDDVSQVLGKKILFDLKKYDPLRWADIEN